MSAGFALPRKLLFRPLEVAEMLGCCSRTIQRRMNQGDFGPLWVEGNQRRITYQGLKSFLESRLEENPAEKS